MIVVFMVLVMLVIGAAAAALAGRWQPEGLPHAAPPETAAPGGHPRFDVVLRGYRMDQVDAELARMRDLLVAGQGGAQGPGEESAAPAPIEDLTDTGGAA